jgi:hypothetical protein
MVSATRTPVACTGRAGAGVRAGMGAGVRAGVGAGTCAGVRTSVGAVVVAAALAVAGCSTTSTRTNDTSGDLAAITAFNARYLKSINDGDIATLSSLTDEGHIMMSANGAPVTG